MVTFCFFELGGKNCNDIIWRFSDLQWVPAKLSCHRNYSLLSKPENDVGSTCVYVWVGVWYMCVHICIIYISNIYYIYLYHISVEGCHGDQPQYICNSLHHPNLSCAFIQDFLVSHQKLTLGRGEERGGETGKPSDFNEIKCLCHQLATFWFYAKLWKIRWMDEELPATTERCPVRLFCVWCRKWQSTNCPLIWSWFSFGKLL